MRRVLWGYRICLGIVIVASVPYLAYRFLVAAFSILFKALSFTLVPPDIAVAGVFFLACICAIVYEKWYAWHKKKTFKAPSVPYYVLPENEVERIFECLRTKYPTAESGEDSFFISFSDGAHGVYAQFNGDDIIVGLRNSLHHEHFGSERMEMEVSSEIDDILQEKNVQIIFFTKDGTELRNDLYGVDKMQPSIDRMLHPFGGQVSLWEKLFQLAFLFLPPFEPQAVRAEVFSARGTYDCVVERETCCSARNGESKRG